MRSPSLRGRLPAGSGLLLIPAASLVVHQLRYTLAYGSRANAELTAQGHSYLYSLTPWFVFALGIGLALFLRRAALVLRTGDAGVSSRRSSLTVWLLAWVGLVAIYALQELLEELLASGHPGGFAGVFGHGGFWAVPVAAAVAGRRHPLPARRPGSPACCGGDAAASLASLALRRRSRRTHADRSGSARPRLRGPCASVRADVSIVEAQALEPDRSRRCRGGHLRAPAL